MFIILLDPVVAFILAVCIVCSVEIPSICGGFGALSSYCCSVYSVSVFPGSHLV